MDYYLFLNNIQHNTYHKCHICNKHNINSKYYLSFFNNKFIIIHHNCIMNILYIFFDIYNDLKILYKIINYSYNNFFKIKYYINNFNNKYKNENTYLLSNFKKNDINIIINISNKLSTKEKIYIFLSKKYNNEL
jgi:hypothetical protein